MSVELREKVGDKYFFDNALVQKITIDMPIGAFGHIHSRSGEYIFEHCKRCGGPLLGHKTPNEACEGDILHRDVIHDVEASIASTGIFGALLAGLDKRERVRKCVECREEFEDRAQTEQHET
jgi:hypothetical protein